MGQIMGVPAAFRAESSPADLYIPKGPLRPPCWKEIQMEQEQNREVPPDTILEQWCSTSAAHLNPLGGFTKLRPEIKLVEATHWALELWKPTQVTHYAAPVDISVLGARSRLSSSTLQLGNKNSQLALATPGMAEQRGEQRPHGCRKARTGRAGSVPAGWGCMNLRMSVPFFDWIQTWAWMWELGFLSALDRGLVVIYQDRIEG